jgi:hypothetical protein
LTVTLDPVAPLPNDLTAPVGRLRMPVAPMQIDNATIVIDNSRLLDYLAPAGLPPPSARR